MGGLNTKIVSIGGSNSVNHGGTILDSGAGSLVAGSNTVNYSEVITDLNYQIWIMVWSESGGAMVSYEITDHDLTHFDITVDVDCKYQYFLIVKPAA